ncbi:hypothetical protein Y981_09485 [Leptospirillum ferriphilum YSK]|uniref:Uncharacterized protein n=1 Tax=Leptospirillum ferriphilum YSK TaxID=1441628 RepID=A0A059XXP6_9BACT|nr:hypothetical protein Y981_09485 [Leptospirillum ferriphilum YSK]
MHLRIIQIEGDQLQDTPSKVPAFMKEALGPTFLGPRISGCRLGYITDEVIKEYIDDPESKQIVDDNRFLIDIF